MSQTNRAKVNKVYLTPEDPAVLKRSISSRPPIFNRQQCRLMRNSVNSAIVEVAEVLNSVFYDNKIFAGEQGVFDTGRPSDAEAAGSEGREQAPELR
jgi:hypothetical protein